MATHIEQLADALHTDSPLRQICPHQPLSHSYYRPQTFSTKTGQNLLIRAAAPLFTLAHKLTQTDQYQNTVELHEHLEHEIKAFEMQAQQLGCRSETILVARYALCALCDEMILHTPWGNDSSWGRYKMLSLFQHEDNANDRFFQILERLQQDAKHYLDILELMYLCLSMGFMGKYRYANEPQQLNAIIDRLYHVIRSHRGEFSKKLSSLAKPAEQTPAVKPKRTLHTWILTTVLITLSSMTCYYLSLSWQAQSLITQLTHT